MISRMWSFSITLLDAGVVCFGFVWGFLIAGRQRPMRKAAWTWASLLCASIAVCAEAVAFRGITGVWLFLGGFMAAVFGRLSALQALTRPRMGG